MLDPIFATPFFFTGLVFLSWAEEFSQGIVYWEFFRAEASSFGGDVERGVVILKKKIALVFLFL